MREVWPGSPLPRGATFDGHGVNFAVYSHVATRVEVCLYDPADPGHEVDRFDLPEITGHTWHPLWAPRPRSLRAGAGTPLQPEQAARRSVRQGGAGRGRLEAADRGVHA